MAEVTNQQRRLKAHEAICRCKACKGTCDKAKLCPACKLLDDLVDSLPDGGSKVNEDSALERINESNHRN